MDLAFKRGGEGVEGGDDLEKEQSAFCTLCRGVFGAPLIISD